MRACKQNEAERQSQVVKTLGAAMPSPKESLTESVHTQGPLPASHLAVENKAPLNTTLGSRLDEFFAFVSDTTGVDLKNCDLALLQRRIKRRMNLNGFASLQDYVQYVERTPGDLEKRLKDSHIHADGFFQDGNAFEAIQKHVFPALLRERKVSGEPIRIWVPECLAGAQVYSMAIALLESMQKQGSDFSINSAESQSAQIFASDISEATINCARKGVYSEASVANVSRERLMQFFVPVHGGYQIHKSVRQICLFAKLDLTKDPSFAHLDLILLNLPNDLGAGWQEIVIPKMYYALKPKGYLMLGPAASLGAFSDQFDVVDENVRLYRKRKTEVLIDSPLALPKAFHRTSEPRTTCPFATLLELEKEIERLLMKQQLPACLVVNGQAEIARLGSAKGASQNATTGRRELLTLKGRRDGFLANLRLALDRAKNGSTLRKEDVVMKFQRGTLKLELEVITVSGDSPREHHYVVLLREPVREFRSTLGNNRCGQKSRATEPFIVSENMRLGSENKHLRSQLESLAQEHGAYVEELQSGNEELSLANEELQSANEEVQAAKEELQSTNEELQSTNEELTSVNAELQRRNVELSTANNDLLNLMGNVPIPWILVGGDMRVWRFTPPAQTLMNLTPDCIGKRLGETGTSLDEKELAQLVREAIRSGKRHEREIQDKAGGWHVLRVRPYKTWDSKLDGAVVSFQDIDALKRTLEQAKVYAEGLFENAREAILLLDGELNLAGANAAFYRTFGVRRSIQGFSLHQLGSHLDISNLRSLLSQVLVGGSRIDDFEISPDLPQAGKRTMILNARRIEPQPASPLILLTIEDITEKRKYLEDLKRHAALLELANDAVTVRDLEGRIQFWNRGAEELYGWKKEEALGKFKEELLQTKSPKPLREIEAELTRRGRWEGELEHVCRDGKRRIVRSCWALQTEGGSSVVLEINSDVTDKKQVEESLRKLSSYLIRVQDEERRRIARELHDSTGQKLIALKMTLDSLGKRNQKLQKEASFSECVGLIDEATREIRTLARLLHPPLLDEAGLALATRWLVDGFSKRSGIVVDLSLPPDLGRMPENVETALFRVIQEALNNIHQHSGANRAMVEIIRTASTVRLRVKDNGKGMREVLNPASKNPSPMLGVGIQGMKERLTQLDGTLEIFSGRNGTTVTAKVPIRPEQ